MARNARLSEKICALWQPLGDGAGIITFEPLAER